MYENPCNNCENYERCMPMMNMPMANMPMGHMPMANMPMANMPMHHMHMANMPMMNMPMMNMPDYEEDDDDDDDDLKKLYPKTYRRIYPIVKHHCDMIEARHGTMYCPSKDEMDDIVEEIYDKCEDYRDDYGVEDFNEDDNDNDNIDVDHDMRQRRRRRRRRIRRPAVGDLIRILFLRDLIGRRRRRPQYGYY